MLHEDIKLVLETTLSQLAKDEGLRVAYTNVRFKPVAGETWLKSSLLPALTLSETLSGDHIGLQGIYQIDVYTDVNVGTKRASDVVRLLNKEFKVNNSYGEGGVVRQISPLHANSGSVQDSNFVVNTWWSYRADINPDT